MNCPFTQPDMVAPNPGSVVPLSLLDRSARGTAMPIGTRRIECQPGTVGGTDSPVLRKQRFLFRHVQGAIENGSDYARQPLREGGYVRSALQCRAPLCDLTRSGYRHPFRFANSSGLKNRTATRALDHPGPPPRVQCPIGDPPAPSR